MTDQVSVDSGPERSIDVNSANSSHGEDLDPGVLLWAFALLSFLMGFSSIIVAFFKLNDKNAIVVAGAPGALGFILVMGGFFLAFLASKSMRRAEISQTKDLERALGKGSNYFEKLANINVVNLSAYYRTVKSHANKSFLAALSVSLGGFLLIGAGIYLVVSGNDKGSVATISSAAGIITQFISAIFFYLYSQTVRQMKEYHDSLLKVQNILLSFKLVEDAKDPVDKAKMTAVMLEYLVRKEQPTPSTTHQVRQRRPAEGRNAGSQKTDAAGQRQEG